MDPFTEKLLERTRARRENLQKKLAERPNAAHRPMAKRSREPLTDTNSVITPQPPSRPSPSKRRCSEENVESAAGEENQEPIVMPAGGPVLLDPPTDEKSPLVPTNIQPSSSLEKSSAQHVAQKKAHPDLMLASPASNPPTNREEQVQPSDSALQKNKEELMDNSTSSGIAMKSRLQRLAEQRRCWDANGTSNEVQDFTPLSLKKQDDVQPAVLPATPSAAPLGRRGRLANLAATIGSWEDDLSHPNVPKEKPGTASVLKCPVKGPTSVPRNLSAAGTGPKEKSVASSTLQGGQFPVKSRQAALPSPRQAETPTSKPPSQPVTSPQKGLTQRTAVPAASSSSTPVTQSPLKNPALSKALNNSPQKPRLCESPTISGALAHQQKASSGSSGVKSFLERFGERCQERHNQNIPAKVATPPKTPAAVQSVVRNTQLVQERLKAAQAANTTTAELTQRQKLERESELARIRIHVQKGNSVWENKDEGAKHKTKTDKMLEEPVQGEVACLKQLEEHVQGEVACLKQLEEPVQGEVTSCKSQDEPTAQPERERADTPKSTSAGPGLTVPPPASTSSPLQPVRNSVETTDETPEEEKEKGVFKEIEMNVDESINSAVINELFDAVLEQSDDPNEHERVDEEEEEEEDALNISSMSLLAPLTETVAKVVKSPERRIMTSTPASSFNEKSNIPQNISKPSKFQRSNMTRTASSDSAEALDEDAKLPYSVDAYRSTRVKESERSSVKQVVVPKEDVSQRAHEPRGSALFSIKQKMKILTNEINLQQTVIHQASQALNCCTDEEHGKGSQVEAEAERLLLVATEKRELLKAALDCLSRDPTGQKKAPQADAVSASKGRITLQEFRLPLKADFVCSIVNKPESTKHSFFIMIRAGAENTVATPLASTHCGLSGDTLTFPTKFSLSDISSDFEVVLEVYCLVQKREICTEKKKKPSKSKAITPKRFLAMTKSAQTPVLASPGGPNAVRTSNFVLVGSHTLTLSSIGKKEFPLEKVPFLCPLEGHVYIKMQCEVGSKVEERGFLTMFEDVSGFGAWHRRWCVLSGYCISYWTYPDDEKRKNPMGRINLTSCANKSVEPANREFCARPNTFELITVRPQREEDKETLVSQCKNTMCVTKNWLSADTKDERNVWMKKLNQILVDLRMWQPEACYRPQ